MKLTLKTVVGKKQELEVKDTATIKEIKETLTEYDLSSLRFCFKGEVLNDDTVVNTLGYKDDDVLVIAGKKAKVAKAAAAATELSRNHHPESSSPDPTHPPQAPSSGTSPTIDTVASPESQPPTVPSSASTVEPAPPNRSFPSVGRGAVSAELVDHVVAMGFEDRQQVALALQAAFMNVDRAVEYLCTGIPESAKEALAESMLSSRAMAEDRISEVNRSDLRASLALMPEFEEVRAMYQQNREVLPVILEQLSQRSPELYEKIQSNIEEFLRIMEERPGANARQTGVSEATADLAGQMPNEIVITPADQAALIRLTELGAGSWDEQASMLVYLACGKDQEAAAMVLLEHGGVPAELLAEILAQQGVTGEQ